ncbi:ABC transporter ATP-binding protein [Desmospora activa]|uniref:Sulfonate transport system ATP-binding protein n=1 Tax=Desmospora activa DSM 45169 TaxID=1121389 RepID=A0A2T4ZBT1_9BACL|nr:ATP-binding cassette domain-containing protein [Desmospora activa]PTM59339.1 sulfonate transport system ATP-binding protein [Desmospora activa DSM 45169]
MSEITVGGLEIKGLQKRFGKRQVLENIDLSIRPGQFTTIVGESGCGKSTFLRLLAGLETPTEGTIIQDGKPVTAHNTATRMMFQDSRLLPWETISDNVKLGITAHPTTAEEEALNMLKLVGLEEYKDEWPSVLSGGQRQRVALARALVSRPRVLLLDEPLGALDALTRIGMQELIEQLWQRQRFTALLVTHDATEAVALADRVILLKKGQVALDLPINLPRPRPRGSAKFSALVETILDHILDRPEKLQNSIL